MIDHNGEQWEPAKKAAELTGIRHGTIRQWVRRGKVRAHRISGRSWVNLPDIRHAEAQWHRRLKDQADVL